MSSLVKPPTRVALVAVFFVLMANGWIKEGDGGPFAFATQIKGEANPVSCQFYLQGVDPFSHFAELTKAIDSMMRTGHAPYPVERTLLTTGILDAAMTSRFKKGLALTQHFHDGSASTR